MSFTKVLMHYKRPELGTSFASEIFHHAISRQSTDIVSVINISDDLAIFGKNRCDNDRVWRPVLFNIALSFMSMLNYFFHV